MSTRKIKDAKDLSTNELIYFKGHAQATFMSDGRTVEDAINSSNGGGGSSDVYDPSIIYFDLLQFENTEWIDDYNNITANGTISQDEYELYYTAALENNKLGLLLDSIYLNNLYMESFSNNWFTVFSTFYEESNNILKYVRVNFKSNLNVYISTGIIETGSAGSGTGITSVKINGVSKLPSSGVVDLGYINKQLSTSTSSSMTLSPNIYYRNTNTNLSTLTISLGSVSNSNILNEYLIEFTTRSSGTTVTLPSSVKWVNGVAPTLENGKTYQISIVNNLGTCTKFG